MDKLMTWLKWTGLVTVLLNFFLLGHAWYYDKQAKEWVSSIEGTYIENTWSEDGFVVQWNNTHNPPACDVDVYGVFASNGYAAPDFGHKFTASEFHSVHLSKNGKISPEPIGEFAYNFIEKKGGEWHYKLEFTFHCSAISKSTWFFWLNLDKTYTVKPVVIAVGESSNG